MGTSKVKLDEECERVRADLDKIWASKTREEWAEILKEAIDSIPTHTDQCYTIMVGGCGTLLNPPRNRKEWICSKDCPIRKNKDEKKVKASLPEE